jgi:hypothetical protein
MRAYVFNGIAAFACLTDGVTLQIGRFNMSVRAIFDFFATESFACRGRLSTGLRRWIAL